MKVFAYAVLVGIGLMLGVALVQFALGFTAEVLEIQQEWRQYELRITPTPSR